ncbi:SRPBCC domain-containing protein [Pollutibacter soli]|uniref:SRPBCC family protein n=1 Tax=Pollutibacter soli TaxID=3034157 RepID=UPI0030137ABB
MNSDLLFNFKVDKTTNTVFVDKEFDAELSLVWDAFTRKEILDQWWAPKPLISKTKYMDFSVGGRRFYATVNPEGVEIGWQIFTYTSITPKSNFKCLGFFTDENERPILPGTTWDHIFTEQNFNGNAVTRKITKVSISIYFESLNDLDKMIEMGFKEGFTVTLNELGLLLKQSDNRK